MTGTAGRTGAVPSGSDAALIPGIGPNTGRSR